ncbi:MAG: hypothetical protein HY738_11810 [Bacteroidia bacterium]|nr:hypothetical protein [Bacteroidia bacterium]
MKKIKKPKKFQNHIVVLILLFCLGSVIHAQNIAITDDDGYTAHPSAMLDVYALDKGVLIPRLTTVQRTSIASPVTGLLVFDSDADGFYFYTGTAWLNLTAGISDSLWVNSGSKVYLNDTTCRVGVGTRVPTGKLEVRGDIPVSSNVPLFEVINSSGDTVFAVYSQGVRIYVADEPTLKSSGSRSGFAVGGFSMTKSLTNEYLRVTPDSVRIYIEKDSSKASGNKGGFAVGGFSQTKGLAVDYFNISGNDSAEVINPSEARVVWYPAKEAFLSGRVLIESADSVGTNAMATGFESKAIGNYSQALGYRARAYAFNSTAIGYQAQALDTNSYAFGNLSVAAANGSYAIGTEAKAKGLWSFAIGSKGEDYYGAYIGPTMATGSFSYAFGMGSQALAKGSFAFGTVDSSTAPYAVAIGYKTKASGVMSTTLGSITIASGTIATAMGNNTQAIGDISLATGNGSIASGWASTAMGNNSSASGQYAFAAGHSANASGIIAPVALGYLPTASGTCAVAIGYSTTAAGDYSTAIGEYTSAGSYGATALGTYINVNGIRSFGIGLDNPFPSTWTITQNNTMAIMGGYVGIGTVAPDKLLHVAGDARIEGSIYYGFGAATYNKPDYVFSTNYDKNFDIMEIEKFIIENKHLPWVTSLDAEKDGVNFTRMGFETLEAVENLQLQIIELKKENISLKNLLQEKDTDIHSLQKEIENIKEELKK